MIYGFKDLTYALPNNLVSIENLLKETSLSNETLENMRHGGLRYIPISTVPIETLIQEAYSKINIVNSNIKGVIYAQSVPFKVDLFPHIPSTTISGQPCAILHTALKFSLDWSEKIKRDILIIGADRIGSIDERLYFNSAMGDVVIVGVIGKCFQRKRSGGTNFGNDRRASQFASTFNSCIASFCQTSLPK